MLRYRLRGAAGERPSSLAHTGDALPDADAPRPGPPPLAPGPVPVPAMGRDGGGAWRAGWVELCPSDLAYHHNCVRSVRCEYCTVT